jgi:hypothetical protein
MAENRFDAGGPTLLTLFHHMPVIDILKMLLVICDMINKISFHVSLVIFDHMAGWRLQTGNELLNALSGVFCHLAPIVQNP